MGQHGCDWRAMCTDEAKTKVRCRSKYEVSPSLANLCEFVPPSFASPSLPSCDTDNIILVSVEDDRTIEIKYVKKRIIVEDMD
jgi:hypothetical protein